MYKTLIIILISFTSLYIWSKINEKQKTKKRIQYLKDTWGKVPDNEYSSEKFKSIASYYQSIIDTAIDVDDITWNDLDMEQIYLLINNTTSSVGEEYLYALLRKPSFSIEDLKDRNHLIKYFSKNEDDRINLQLILSKMGKLQSISVHEYINRLDNVNMQSNLPHYMMAFGLVLSIIMIFIKPSIGSVLTVIFLANNIISYYKRQAEIDSYLTVFAYIIRILEGAKEIARIDIETISSYNKSLLEKATIFKSFKRGSRILTSKKNSGDFLDVFLDYYRMLFHSDLIKFNKMLTFINKNRDGLNEIFEIIGYLDSIMAIGSFRTMMNNYCEPELTKEGKPFINIIDLYHPLIDSPITNSITENKSMIITGSNASGKSTFIKTLAINAILSQTIYTSLSTSHQSSYFKIYSSMALRDNLFNNESYYIVEIKSLKRILDTINENIPTLCFVDEVLRGTNTLERIAASSRILEELSKKNALVIAATHDIELTHILENPFSNYHFLEQIIDDKVVFDYKLHPGRSLSRNAIKLLGMLGYPKEIISSAEDAVDEFLAVGNWSNI